jgi:hypothetical protein
MPEGFLPGSNLLLLEYTRRLFRDDKSTQPPTALRRPATHNPPLATAKTNLTISHSKL